AFQASSPKLSRLGRLRPGHFFARCAAAEGTAAGRTACSAARSFGKKKKEVEARAGIEPACKDLQSLGFGYRWVLGGAQLIELLDYSGSILAREHTGTFCVIPRTITHELRVPPGRIRRSACSFSFVQQCSRICDPGGGT